MCGTEKRNPCERRRFRGGDLVAYRLGFATCCLSFESKRGGFGVYGGLWNFFSGESHSDIPRVLPVDNPLKVSTPPPPTLEKRKQTRRPMRIAMAALLAPLLMFLSPRSTHGLGLSGP